MKIKTCKIIFFYFVFLFAQANAITNKILLKVENEIITNYEVKNKILTSLVLAGNEISQENINLIVDKANGDRGFLEIELQKIYLFLDGKTI